MRRAVTLAAGRASSLVLGLMVAVPAFASGGESGPETVWGLPPLFWKIFNFVLFFGVLGWLLRKPLGQFFRGRRESIAHQLAEATRQREEAERLQRDMETRIAGLETEISTSRSDRSMLWINPIPVAEISRLKAEY